MLRSTLPLVLVLLGCGSSTVANGSDSGPDVPPGVCIGVTPPKSAWAEKPGPIVGGSADGSTDAPADAADEAATDASGDATADASADATDASFDTSGDATDAPGEAAAPPSTDPHVVGSLAPTYALTDIQPLSCGYKATYGLPVYRDRVTLVVLLAGWCGFCQAQAMKLEQLRVEFERAGKPVGLVIVNKADAADYQAELTRRTSIPILQDLDSVQAWSIHHRGNKDDFYIYGKDGKLADYLPVWGPRDTNLSGDGYAVVKGAILAVVGK